MLLDDLKALNDRFAGGMDVTALQVLVENQPDESIDTSRIYCRWVIDPSGSKRIENGPSAHVTQLGVAILQIIAPSGTYVDDAYAVRQQFHDLFKDWRSDDRALEVLGFSDTKRAVPQDPTTKEPAYLQLNCQFAWRSHRAA